MLFVIDGHFTGSLESSIIYGGLTSFMTIQLCLSTGLILIDEWELFLDTDDLVSPALHLDYRFSKI